MTKRPTVFLADTRLWNAAEGWRTFPKGETDPGGAWHEVEGGRPVGSDANAAVLKDLIAAQDQIEQRDAAILKIRSDLDVAVAEKEGAIAKLADAEQRAVAAETARDEIAAAAAQMKVELDQSIAYGRTLEARLAAPASEPTRAPVAAPAPAEAAAEAQADGPGDDAGQWGEAIAHHPFDLDGDGQPGGSKPAEALDDIPEDFAKLPWFTLKALAKKFAAGAEIENKGEAIAVIEGELARRAAA